MRFRKLSPAVREELRSYVSRYYAPSGEEVRADCLEAAEPVTFCMPAARSVAPPGQKPPCTGNRAAKAAAPAESAALPQLDRIVVTLDESFQEMLLRKIDEKGIKDSACYKRAGVDRKLFSKIRSNPRYQPKKTTAVAFAVALELGIDETRELLMKAGYALSRSSIFDVIVEYFITHHRYSVSELNEALYEYDQPLV